MKIELDARQRNLKLEIEYDGTNYCGWQIQKSHQVTRLQGHKSIQETIEKTLSKILQEKIHLIASGRTDARVHALAQTANFKTRSKILTDKLQKALNSLLPEDIVINSIEEADENFHSRFSAKSKTYRYLILNQPYPSVFLKDKAYFCPHKLNIRLMRREALFLSGRHDFKGFCSSGSSVKSTVRTIKRISVGPIQYSLCAQCRPLIAIDVEADGFLYNMVRSIVGTLLDIGRGRFEKGRVRKILDTKNRKLCGITAPAKGLYLVKVIY